LGGKGRTVEIVEGFLNDTSIDIDWTIDEPIWRTAANAFQLYAARRRRQGQHEPRRLVTDFIVGAHAVERGFALLTFDNRLFKKAFPSLKIVAA
jgi:predicted nucleic acid-binding protein